MLSEIIYCAVKWLKFTSEILIYIYLYLSHRIYVRGEFTRKKCKTAILLYCFHTAGVHDTYLCYITVWALEYHFIENLKLLLKENQIMK